jgi:hypothetical protein
VLAVPPTANTKPFGLSTAAPISSHVVFTSDATVLPAVVHLLVVGLNTSVFFPFQTSTVKTSPLGSKFQPSSEFWSALPLPAPIIVHVNALSSNCA